MSTQPASFAKAERPKWLDDTPGRDESYQLAEFVDGGSEQLIHITREEFIALKYRLAKMRGLDTSALRSHLSEVYGNDPEPE